MDSAAKSKEAPKSSVSEKLKNASAESLHSERILMSPNKCLCGNEHLCLFDSNGNLDGYDCRLKDWALHFTPLSWCFLK